MLEQQIERDLKAALLNADRHRVTTLRGIKSVILNYKVEKGKRGSNLSDEEVITLLAKEVKKRQESAELYLQGGNQERADLELSEKAIIDQYLPEKISDEALGHIIDEVIESFDAHDKLAMGPVIAAVKARTKGSADGAMIAKFVKEKLN